MAKKVSDKFVLYDAAKGCLVDSDIYGSEKEAVDWARDIAQDCDETVDLVVCKLVPTTKIGKNVPEVQVTKVG